MAENPQVAELAKQAVNILYDCLIRVFALQEALAKKGLLSEDQISAMLRSLNDSPPFREFREKWGIAGSEFASDLDRLLQNYRGPIQ